MLITHIKLRFGYNGFAILFHNGENCFDERGQTSQIMKKRIISYILAIALLITSINIPSIQLNAEESVSKEESSVVDTPDATPEDSLEPTPSPHETKTPTNEETNKDEESADEEDDAEGATPAPEATPGQSRKALSFLFTAPAAQPYDEGETVIMYGDTGNGSKVNLAASEKAEFAYGTKITLSLDGVSDSVQFRIKKAGVSEDVGYNESVIYEPGYYGLGYSYTKEDETNVEDDSCENYGFTIVRAKLGVPSNLDWDGTNATWDALAEDKNGNPLKDDAVCDYIVTLYKDGRSIAEETVAGSNEVSPSYDFAEVIDSETGGGGKYTFSVKALVPPSLEDYYEDAEESSQSAEEDALYAVKVTLVPKKGIATAVTTGSDTAFLLISGATGHNEKEIYADAESDWEFAEWSIEDGNDGDSGISFTSATSADTVVKISDGYSGSTGVRILATAKEGNAPEIAEYTSGTDDNVGKLVATAKDSQSGLKAYAFSTADSSDGIEENEWRELASATVEEKTVTFTPETGGEYFFYAKDADGNIKRSDQPVPVTIITYDGYYENNNRKEIKDFFIGSGSFQLPDLTDTDETIHRKGYTFDGWYSQAGGSGTKVSSLSRNAGGDVRYYAKWNLTELTWKTALADKETDYIGNEIKLTAKVNDTTADVIYTWYKKGSGDSDFTEIASDKTGAFSVRNVSDSGTYRVDAKITYKDDEDKEQTKELKGDAVTITIKPVALEIKAVDQEITYGDNAPEYKVTYTGLKGEDITDLSKAHISVGSLTCVYQQWDPCKEGGYSISFDTENKFDSENYLISTIAGTLTVKPRNVNAADSAVTVTLENADSYIYTGSEITPDIIIKDGDRDISAYHALIKSGYEDPVPHVHQAAHIIIALEQEITCTVGEENYCCRGIVIPSNVKHTIVSEGMPVIIFLFEETTITAEQIKETRVIEPEIAVKMAELYEKLLAKAVDKNAGCKMFYAKVTEYLRIEMPGLKNLDERIMAAITFVHEHADEDITVKKIAEMQYMSESRFSHLFKENTGISFAGFLIMARIEKAYEGILLGKNITEASVDAGFYSPAHFASVNKKMFGITASSLVGDTNVYRIAEI